LKTGDLIAEAGGQALANWVEFRQAMGARKPGDSVKLKVRRGDETLEIELTLAERQLDQDKVGPPGRRRPPPKKDDKKKDEDEDDDEKPMQEPKKDEPPKKEEPK